MARNNFYVMQYLIFTFQRTKEGQGKNSPGSRLVGKEQLRFVRLVLHRQDNQLFSLDTALASFAVLAINVQRVYKTRACLLAFP